MYMLVAMIFAPVITLFFFLILKDDMRDKRKREKENSI